MKNNQSNKKASKEQIKKLENSCTSLNKKVTQINSEKENMKPKLTDLEAHSMRENLVFFFFGITESKTGKCEQLVKTFCQDKLDIDATNMTFDRAHRMGLSGIILHENTDPL